MQSSVIVAAEGRDVISDVIPEFPSTAASRRDRGNPRNYVTRRQEIDLWINTQWRLGLVSKRTQCSSAVWASTPLEHWGSQVERRRRENLGAVGGEWVESGEGLCCAPSQKIYEFFISKWCDMVHSGCLVFKIHVSPVVKVDRRIRWHYTTAILRLRIGARLTGYRNCKFHNFAGTISRHADGISRYSVPPSAGPLLPLCVPWIVVVWETLYKYQFVPNERYRLANPCLHKLRIYLLSVN